VYDTYISCIGYQDLGRYYTPTFQYLDDDGD